jgi:hypothetical protein
MSGYRPALGFRTLFSGQRGVSNKHGTFDTAYRIP